ncbi:MAG: hypothetical protein WC595_06630 [Candidatus Nanoarchaeia archaeon]
MLTCVRCHQEKELVEFGKDGSWCKKCHSHHAMERRKENPEKWKKYLKDTWTQPNMIFARKKANAKENGIVFTLDKERFIQWYENQSLNCYYCGLVPEDFKRTMDGYLLRKVNLGLDRVDNVRGYEEGNIVLCCNRCNTVKGSFFTHDEMKFIAEKFIKPKWEARGIKLKNEEIRSISIF